MIDLHFYIIFLEFIFTISMNSCLMTTKNYFRNRNRYIITGVSIGKILGQLLHQNFFNFKYLLNFFIIIEYFRFLMKLIILSLFMVFYEITPHKNYFHDNHLQGLLSSNAYKYSKGCFLNSFSRHFQFNAYFDPKKQSAFIIPAFWLNLEFEKCKK